MCRMAQYVDEINVVDDLEVGLMHPRQGRSFFQKRAGEYILIDLNQGNRCLKCIINQLTNTCDFMSSVIVCMSSILCRRLLHEQVADWSQI